jgi:chromosome segregation ATPase
VKFATELEPITPMIKEVNGKKKELFGQLDALRDSSTSKQKEIDAIKASLDEQKGEANEKKDALDKTSEELDELSKQMNEIFEQKDAAKDTFWKEMFDHREQ